MPTGRSRECARVSCWRSYFNQSSSAVVNILFLLFFPFLVWQLDVLPAVTIGVHESDVDFAKRVQRDVARRLGA